MNHPPGSPKRKFSNRFWTTIKKTMKNANLRPGKKIELPDVTLVTLDTVTHDLTRLAVNECLRHINFGAVLIFSNQRIEVSGSEHIACDASNIREALLFRWHRVPDYVRTSHYLTVEWDSWVLEPQMWRPSFLDFDYIGAPWDYSDDYNVGNGGFSLRSTQLARFVSKHVDRFPPLVSQHASAWWPDDAALCRIHRPILEQEGFRWADEATASDFAVEHTSVAGHDHHFGFHGMCNWPMVLSLPELAERMKYFNDYIIQHPHFRPMLAGLGFRYGAERPFLPWRVRQPRSAPPQSIDAMANPVSDIALPARLRTIFGTVFYIDEQTGELRHGAADVSPANLVLAGEAPFLGQNQHVQLDALANTAAKPRITYSAAKSYRVFPADLQDAPTEPVKFELRCYEDGSCALRTSGLFLCAEEDGRITLSRGEAGPWERFQPAPLECPVDDSSIRETISISPGIDHKRYHLGCGPNLVPGYLNIDAVGDVEVSRVFADFQGVEGAFFINRDLRHGIPGYDNNLEVVYSCHFLEHLTYVDGINLLRQARLRLRPGGLMRILVPDLELWIKNYHDDTIDFFTNYRHEALGNDILLYRTKGSVFMGMLHNFDHRCGYDFETLAGLLHEIGFTNIRRTAFREGRLPGLLAAEPDWSLRAMESLCIECEKPADGIAAPIR